MAASLITEVPKVVLGVAAHADDLDFMAGGTLAAWARAGAKVYYLILTNGDKGTADPAVDPRDLAGKRRQEQLAAAKAVGAADVFFCDYEDGLLAATYEVKRDVARIIRTVRPDTVVTVDPTMLYSAERGFINHTDHRAAGQTAIDAVYPLARDHLSFPELLQTEQLQPHKVKTLYLTHFGRENCYVDITSTLASKLQALEAHVSQVDVAEVRARITHYARQDGELAGVQYAEGFVRITIA